MHAYPITVSRLLCIKQTPHVMARPLPSSIVSDIARRILLRNLRSGGVRSTLARPEAHFTGAGVFLLTGNGVVYQGPRGLTKWFGGLRADACPSSARCGEEGDTR